MAHLENIYIDLGGRQGALQLRSSRRYVSPELLGKLKARGCKITHGLGPSVVIRSPRYGCSETIAKPYGQSDPPHDVKISMINGLSEFMEVSSDGTPQAVLPSVRTIQLHIFKIIISLVGACRWVTI